MHDKIILVFGASTEWGAWDKEGGWAQRLKRVTDEISLRNKERDIMLYNLGIPGDSTRELLRRVEPEFNARVDKGEEAILIFSIGVNDSYYFTREKRLNVPQKEFRENLETLSSIARGCTCHVIFLGLHPVDERVDPVPWRPEISYKPEHLKEYDEIIRGFCNENNIHFIDILSRFSGRERKLLEDGVHPNSDGHKLIFESVRDYLVENKLI